MQPSGGGGGGGGSGELSKGLARFRSAPATWLEALLESEEEDDPLKPTQFLTQLPPTSSAAPTTQNSTANYVSSADPALYEPDGAASGLGFFRHNSSPADFLSQISTSGPDGYYSNFGISPNYDYLSSSIDVSTSSKRPKDVDSEHSSAKFSSQSKGESSGQLHGGMNGLLDAEMDKLFEESVPCRARAKRGCATHPRSIAERVRRTRISDRIRKLQELVPNMDKQTNTADMLEEAVDYVMFLQRQIQELTEHQKNCKCINKD